LEKLICGLNNDLKSKNFSEIEKNNIILKIGILGAYTKKLTRVSQRLLKNEHDGETIKNTYINSLPQVNVEWKQGEKDSYSEKEKNFELPINADKKNSKSKKRIKFSDTKNIKFFDKEEKLSMLSNEKIDEEIKKQSKKEPKKSALRKREETIKFTNIRNDNSNQNTGKIQLENPDYDEEE
jgi:hypothetical protein